MEAGKFQSPDVRFASPAGRCQGSRAFATIRGENGTKSAPSLAKKPGHHASLKRELLMLTPIRRQPFSIATSTSDLTNVVFCHVSFPISRMNVSARRIFALQTDLM
jgi:hypothetical protein